MENRKRAIVLDMDETLEHGVFKSEYDFFNEATMILRPGLDELIIKLQEAKQQGIDIILCTMACEAWVESFLELKPEFKMLLDSRFTRDNLGWIFYSPKLNPLEYEARQKDHDLTYAKPVTTFGYDSVLFIDDRMLEADRLKRLFKITEGKLEKDVTFFSGFGFFGEIIDSDKLLRYKQAAHQSTEIAKKLEQYLEIERNEPGCHMMCSVIDKFMSKSFSPGVTIVDEDYSEEYDLFRDKRDTLKKDLDELVGKIESFHEDAQTEHQKDDKREKLGELVQVAKSIQTRLQKTKRLKAEYQQAPKGPEIE